MPFGPIYDSAASTARLAALERSMSSAMAAARDADTIAHAAATTAQDVAMTAAAMRQAMVTKSDLTPLQQAATSASSTIASSENVHATLQAEIDALTKTKYWLCSEIVHLPSIAIGATQPVTVVWSTPAPAMDYSVTASISDPGALLGSLSVAVDMTTRTTTSVKVKVKNGGLVALSLNAVQLLVIGARGYRPN